MEKRRNYTIVMDENGQFHKAIPLELDIGAQTYYENKNPKWFIIYRFLTSSKFILPAILLLLLTCILPFYIWNSSEDTYAFVSIDIQPSLELVLNEDMNIKSIVALNEEAETLLDNLSDIKGSFVSNGTAAILDKTAELSMLKERESVLIGVSYINNKQEKDDITSELDDYFQNNKLYNLVIYKVPVDIRNLAHEQQVSVNQVMANEIERGYQASTFEEAKGNSLDSNEEELIQLFYK